MPTTVAADNWQAKLPAGWEWPRDDECVTMYHPDGVGVLQISAAVSESAVTDSDLQEFARKHLDRGARTRAVSCGDFAGFTLAFGTEDAYWRHWYLRSGRRMLFATYNCDPEDLEQEDNAICRIMAALRALTPA